MSISNKTRKILWGRSGNRCAICKNELIIDATENNDETVIAEECHIISSRRNGPRHDLSYPESKLDSYDNLILLCRIHHKLIDDQVDTFTTDIVRQMKSNHETWVSQQLSENMAIKPVRLRRVKQNIPDFLYRLKSGKEILNIVIGAMGYYFDHDELHSQEEIDLVSCFLQLAQDWGDIGDTLEIGERIQTGYKLTENIQELEEAGFWIFGGLEVQILEGGVQPEPSNWPIAIIRVIRKNNKEIIDIDPNKMYVKMPSKATSGDTK